MATSERASPPIPVPEARRAPAATSSAAGMVPALAAEFVGTFVLVFAIISTAMAAGTNHPVAGLSYDSLAIALVNGIALATLVAALGHVSGAHLNPAVSVALAAIGKFPWRNVPGYVVAQVAGGTVAGLAGWVVAGNAGRDTMHLAANAPGKGVSDVRALITEALITFVLVLVVTSVATDSRVPAGVAPVAIGFALATAVFIGGPVDGAAVNPARSLGPEIASGSFTGWWIFIVGPLAGGLAAALAYRHIIGRVTTARA